MSFDLILGNMASNENFLLDLNKKSLVKWRSGTEDKHLTEIITIRHLFLCILFVGNLCAVVL